MYIYVEREREINRERERERKREREREKESEKMTQVHREIFLERKSIWHGKEYRRIERENASAPERE